MIGNVIMVANDLGKITDLVPSAKDFNVQYLKTNFIEDDSTGAVIPTLHYVLNYSDIGDSFHERALSAFNKLAKTLEFKINEFKAINPSKKGTIYFSPANKFSTVNTEAQEVYAFCFEYEDRLDLQIESNFIVI